MYFQADFSQSITHLPRRLGESQVLPIELKRKLEFKHPYRRALVRPSVVLGAARWLIANSDVYKREGLQLHDGYDLDKDDDFDPELVTRQKGGEILII
ncbi:MAG: hypothetical protein GY739_17125 [Mesoflavibacter sp.]|nr:hypothetical protein [Mesoflavibacter sp.]